MTVGLPPLHGEPAADGSDCVACGRCCHHGPSTVTLLEADEARMGPERLERLTVLHPRPPYFRFIVNDGEACGALDRTVPGHYPCSIYDVRPSGCREVEPGSPACLEARAQGQLGTSVGFKRP
jgi:Fe-S-cluster containining protein